MRWSGRGHFPLLLKDIMSHGSDKNGRNLKEGLIFYENQSPKIHLN